MRRIGLIYVPILLAALVVITIFLLPRKAEFSLSRYSYQAMGTNCHIVVVTASGSRQAQSLADAAFARVAALDALASTYKPQSEVSQLSVLKPRRPKTLSPEIYAVLDRSLYYSRLTDGAFDVSVGPLIKLWQNADHTDTPPAAADIARTLKSVGYRHIILNPADKTVALKRPGMSITLDAIIPGYAADVALESLRQAGIPAALVDTGGEIACYGAPPGKDAWTVGIQNPFHPATASMDTSPGAILATIRLSNAAVATSGNYQRFYQIAGRNYSQIFDPRTGSPVQQAASVTIIAPTATDADALSTACSVLPVEEALELISKIPHTQALLITGSPDAPVLHFSTGFEKYLLTPLPGSPL